MSGEESDHKGDPDSTRLMGKVMDRLDGLMFKHGFEFRDENQWEEMAAELEKLLFKYYDDLTGGDESYNPNESSTRNSDEAEENDEEEEEKSATLTSSSEEDSAEKAYRPQKRTRELKKAVTSPHPSPPPL